MIRKITENDKAKYMEYVNIFYNSDAVLHPVPKENFENTFNELMSSSAYAECFMLEEENKPVGYCLIAKTFSQEAGGMVIWIEELYVEPDYRSKGIGTKVFDFLKANYPEAKRLRLEAEEENERAIALYKRLGFTELEYKQFIIE